MTIASPEAYAAVRDALLAGLSIVREHEARGDFVPKHFAFPKMGHFKSGFPQFSKCSPMSAEAPRDYTEVFRDGRSPDKIPEWALFYALARTNSRLKSYFDATPDQPMELEGDAEFRDERLTISIGSALKNLVDRYIHLTGKKEFDEAAFVPIYKEWERAVFSERLAIDILVPLLMVTCEFDALEVAAGLSIERMAELFQLARSTERRILHSANEFVVGAATHAVVFHGWSIKNDSRWIRWHSLSSAKNFRDVIEKLDYFLAALRTVSGVQTGYGQFIIRPDGWSAGGSAYLPQVEIIPLRAYPDHFEEHGWLRTPPVLDVESCREAGKLYTALTPRAKKQLLLASRRLNLAMLRNSEQDSIIDVTIGLETLLVPDGGKGEINHKLAMRLAALSRMRSFEGYRPAQVFGFCKKLYDFRSAVAHGTQDISTKRVIKVQEATEPVETLALGISLLRYAIRFLVEKPEYLEANTLDMTLFGGDELAAGEAGV